MGLSKDERLQKSIKKHPKWKDHRHANSVDCHVADVRRIRAGAPTRKKSLKTLGLSRAEFLGRYDPTTRMRNMLKEAVGLIERGRFYEDYELRRAVGCGDAKLWRDLAGDPSEGFTDYQFIISPGDKTIWSDRATVSDLLATNRKARSVAP